MFDKPRSDTATIEAAIKASSEAGIPARMGLVPGIHYSEQSNNSAKPTADEKQSNKETALGSVLIAFDEGFYGKEHAATLRGADKEPVAKEEPATIAVAKVQAGFPEASIVRNDNGDIKHFDFGKSELYGAQQIAAA